MRGKALPGVGSGEDTAPGGKTGNKLAGKAAGGRGPARIPVAWKKADHKKPGNFKDL